MKGDLTMIIKEFYKTTKDGVNLYRTFSNEGLQIQKLGTDEVYDEAIDVEPCSYTYVETDEFIDGNEEISGDEFKEMVESEVL